MDRLTIELHQIGKRFGRQWLFQNVSFLLQSNKVYALTGNNGSGKSTLLQIIYGYQSTSKGKVVTLLNNQTFNHSDLFQHSSFVAPYLDLPDELTVEEQLNFHFSFKAINPNYTVKRIMDEIWLSDSANKKIKYLSSGMRQRLKLAQVFYAQNQAAFFDEPCTNLDQRGMDWYRNEMMRLRAQCLVVIASNQLFEYDFADEVIVIPQ